MFEKHPKVKTFDYKGWKVNIYKVVVPNFNEKFFGTFIFHGEERTITSHFRTIEDAEDRAKTHISNNVGEKRTEEN